MARYQQQTGLQRQTPFILYQVYNKVCVRSRIFISFSMISEVYCFILTILLHIINSSPTCRIQSTSIIGERMSRLIGCCSSCCGVGRNPRVNVECEYGPTVHTGVALWPHSSTPPPTFAPTIRLDKIYVFFRRVRRLFNMFGNNRVGPADEDELITSAHRRDLVEGTCGEMRGSGVRDQTEETDERLRSVALMVETSHQGYDESDTCHVDNDLAAHHIGVDAKRQIEDPLAVVAQHSMEEESEQGVPKDLAKVGGKNQDTDLSIAIIGEANTRMCKKITSKDKETRDAELVKEDSREDSILSQLRDRHFQFHPRIHPDDLEAVVVNSTPVVVGQGRYGKVMLRKLKGKLVVEKMVFKSNEMSEVSLLKRLLWEAEACRISDGITGFPYYFGTVDRQPIRSFVTQYLGDAKTFRSCTLYDLCCFRGSNSLTNTGLLKVLFEVVYAVKFQQDAGLFHCDLKSDNVLIHTDDNGKHVAKLIDLGLSERIPRDGRVLSPSSRYVEDDFEENKDAFPHVAPEILLNRSGDTYATETFAIGYIFEEVGVAFCMPRLCRLADECQALEPSRRPSLEDICWTLRDIKMIESHFESHPQLDPDDLEPITVNDGNPFIMGRGGYGRTILRRYQGKLVVEKILHATESTEWLQRVLWEAEACRLAGGITGFPEYIGTVDYCDQLPAIVTEFLGDTDTYTTRTLYDVLCNTGPMLTSVQLIKVLIDVVSAIDVQQKLGMFHSDIKTDNVLIVREPHDGALYSGKLIDLGQCRRINGNNVYNGVCNNEFLQRPVYPRAQFEEKRRDCPHLAPELLLLHDGKPEDTYETETYALGWLFKEVGRAFDITGLCMLGDTCQATKPRQRPSTELLIVELHALLAS